MRFLLAVIDDRSNSGSAEEMQAIDAFNDRLSAAGQLILACGITDPTEAFVIDNRAGAGIESAGPLHEVKEFMSGFWLIHASSVEEAREIASRGSKACNRKVELRQLHG